MVLYKATEAGNIPMTEEEEKEIRSEWSADKARPKRKTLEERVMDLEAAIEILSKDK